MRHQRQRIGCTCNHVPGVPTSDPRWRSPVRQRLVDAADRRVAAVAHLSIAVGVFIGVGFLLGLAINLVIWLRSRRSPFVEYHSEQAGTYQFVVFVLNILFVVIWISGIIGLMGGSEIGDGLLSMRQLIMG